MGTFGGGAGGFTPDNITLATNVQQQGEIKYPAITVVNSSEADITYSTNTALSADVYAKSVTINNGITVTTNGFNFYCISNFTNNGTVTTGTKTGTGGSGHNGSPGGNSGYGIYIQADTIDNAGTITTSGGASPSNGNGTGGGGGGGAGSIVFAYKTSLTQGTKTTTGGAGWTGSVGTGGSDTTGGVGGSTVAAGGAAGFSGTNPTVGTSPSAPTLTNALLNTWFTTGMYTFLIGGGGGQGNSNVGAPVAGTSFTSSYGGSGGGGGWQNQVGASGGGGRAITYQYTTLPIAVTGFTYSVTSNSILNNRISAYSYDVQSTASLTYVNLASITITPNSSGILTVKAIVSVYNDTLTDGTQIQIANGVTAVVASQVYTQEGAASNPDTLTVYYEITGTVGTPLTVNLNGQAVTGGNSYFEIVQFEVAEVFGIAS